MPEVKLLSIIGYYDNYDDWVSTATNGISDWEVLSDEDYKLLKDNLYRLNRQMAGIGERLVIATKDVVPARARITTIREWIDIERKKQEAERLAREQKLAANREKKEAKARERELKLLEKLKTKYEEQS
jgi:hypothetical protein